MFDELWWRLFEKHVFSEGSYGKRGEYISKGFGWGGVLRRLGFDSKTIRKRSYNGF